MLQRAVLGIVLNGLALYAVAYFLDDITYEGGILFFVLGGAIMGMLNFVIKPMLKAASFPLVFLTAGAFLIVINTALLWLTKTALDILSISNVALHISGFFNYLIAGLVFGLMNWIEHLFIKNK